VAFRITGDAGTAEELLQDTFLQLWLKASQFDTARGSLIGWLLTITRHRAIDRLRQNGSRIQFESLREETTLSPGNTPTALTQQIAHELVTLALADLPKVQREAISLAYFEGLTSEEIAECSSTPLGTIKSRLRIALRKMQRSLSDSRPSPPRVQNRRDGTLKSILITEQLSSRTCKPRPSLQEAACRQSLVRTAVASPEQLIDCFLEMPIDLCGAGTAGLSLLETNASGEQEFRWTNLAGKLAKCVGGTTPRHFSPCGVTLDRNSPQLFAYPGRHFTYFNQVEVPIVEGLVIPFRIGDATAGTVWIVSHDEQTKFDAQDVEIMSSLAEFVGCTIHVSKSFDAGDSAECR
jgi:RNA polymerase sigma factor (sigma-70 family)